MDMNLQSLSSVCFASGRTFEDGQRVASYLVRTDPAAIAAARAATGDEAASTASAGASAGKGEVPEVLRYDLLESEAANFSPPGRVVCRWVQIFKPRKQADNPERELKLTAESLFLSMADSSNAGLEVAEEEAVNNTRMLQVLALMLERKRVLRPKGASADGKRSIYEHAKTKQLYEVAAVTDLSPEFFLSIQEQLAALVGGNVKAAPALQSGDAETAANTSADPAAEPAAPGAPETPASA